MGEGANMKLRRGRVSRTLGKPWKPYMSALINPINAMNPIYKPHLNPLNPINPMNPINPKTLNLSLKSSSVSESFLAKQHRLRTGANHRVASMSRFGVRVCVCVSGFRLVREQQGSGGLRGLRPSVLGVGGGEAGRGEGVLQVRPDALPEAFQPLHWGL